MGLGGRISGDQNRRSKQEIETGDWKFFRSGDRIH